jgi:hypothetical protein
MDSTTQVVALRLERLGEMFEEAPADPFSERYRAENGIDHCIGELLVHSSRRSPVRLEVQLPMTEIEPGTEERLRLAVGRYCDARTARNLRERRLLRLTGFSSLKVGLPVALIGLSIASITAFFWPQEDTSLANLSGWVLAWIGLWYPLDSIFFAHVSPNRENAVLQRLRDARIVIQPAEPMTSSDLEQKGGEVGT